jgi:hypothetical protein
MDIGFSVGKRETGRLLLQMAAPVVVCHCAGKPLRVKVVTDDGLPA